MRRPDPPGQLGAFFCLLGRSLLGPSWRISSPANAVAPSRRPPDIIAKARSGRVGADVQERARFLKGEHRCRNFGTAGPRLPRANRSLSPIDLSTIAPLRKRRYLP
jgi:hypothetical protein